MTVWFRSLQNIKKRKKILKTLDARSKNRGVGNKLLHRVYMYVSREMQLSIGYLVSWLSTRAHGFSRPPATLNTQSISDTLTDLLECYSKESAPTVKSNH